MPAKDAKNTLWMITANDLRQGNVVYLASDGSWVNSIEDAQQFSDNASAEARLPQATAQQLKVIDPYLIEVTRTDNGDIYPVHFREQFRISGPTHKLAKKSANPATKVAA